MNAAGLLTALGIDEVIARYSSAGGRYYLTDALSSVIAQTNSDRTVQNVYSYSPYGQVTSLGPDGGNPIQYTARENDGTGLVYYRARYYEPNVGRFISEDPVGAVGGLNFYAYVGGDPLNYTDPTGECPWCIGAAIGFGFDLVSQLIENGGNLGCISLSRLAMNTALGAVGGGLGGKALTGALRGLANGTKGRIGETLSIANNRLMGSRLTGTQVRIPGQRTIADSAWQSLSGATYHVESKFGTAGLTSAQRAAANALGNAYHVERWGYPFFGRVGGYAGGTAGAAAGQAASGDCGCK